MYLCDYLPHIDFVMSLGLVSDVPRPTSDIHQFEAMLLNTWKPVVFTATGFTNLTKMIDLALTVAGGLEELQRKPFACLYAEPISPLRHDPESIRKIFFMAERNLPVIYCPGMMAGATGPVTLAGALVLANAELLSAVTLTQLKRAGAPYIYGGGIMFTDMRTAVPSFGAPEFLMGLAALAEMGHYYDLPIWGYAGCSDSKALDQQAAVESVMSIYMAALTGSNLVHDVCYLESAMASCYEMVVLGNEMIAMVKQMMKGIEFTPETMAIDVIDQVGPTGNYLTAEHTLKHFRKNWYSDLIDRQNRESWEQAGKLTMGERLNRKVKGILASYAPEPFPDDVQRAVRKIIEETDEELA
jgi:trimethylamine--corrinoid protein Co-methyltransferase